jgi:hypothetical protein
MLQFLSPYSELHRCKQENLEASKANKETLPGKFTRDDLNSFNVDQTYNSLLDSHPTYMAALAGTVMSHQKATDIKVNIFLFHNPGLCIKTQDPFRFGFGGRKTSRLVSLQSSLVLGAGQAIHIGHPRSFVTIQNITSLLFSAGRLPGPIVNLQHQLGLCHSKESGQKILDTLLQTVRQPIFDMKAEIEAALAAGQTSDGTGRTGPAGFLIESDNVSLEVIPWPTGLYSLLPVHPAETQHRRGAPRPVAPHDPEPSGDQPGAHWTHGVRIGCENKTE